MNPHRDPKPTTKLPPPEVPTDPNWKASTGLWLVFLGILFIFVVAGSARAESQPAYCADESETSCASHQPTVPAHYEEDRNRSLRDGNSNVQLGVLITSVMVALALVRNKF